jgi:hypothetical protein
LWVDGAVVFSTSPESRKGRNLARDRRSSSTSRAETTSWFSRARSTLGSSTTASLDLYEAKYDYRPGGEGDWYSLRPRVGYAWREQELPRCVTRFSFPT